MNLFADQLVLVYLIYDVAATYIRGQLGYSIEHCFAEEIYEPIF